MNEIRVFLHTHHQRAVGLLFAAIAAYGAYNAYAAGINVGMFRNDTARAASEALGG